MKKAKLLVPVILLMSGAMLFGADFSQYGMTVLSTTTDTTYTEYRVRDAENHVFEVLARNPLTEANFNTLSLMTGTIYKFRYLSVKSLRIVYTGDRINAIVVPSSFTYKDSDFTGYLPSGLQFYYDTSLEYDFRIMVDNLTLKIAGEFFTETQLCERLVSAVSNPLTFILSSNPEYLMEKILELQQQGEEFRAYGLAATQEFNDALTSLAATDKKLEDTKNDLAATGAELQNTRTDLAAARTDLDTARSDLSSLTESFNSLAKDYDALQGNYLNLKKAVILVANQGIFSTIKKFNVAGIERAIAVKKDNPSLTDKELVAALKTEGINLSPKEAFLVNQVFYFDWNTGDN